MPCTSKYKNRPTVLPSIQAALPLILHGLGDTHVGSGRVVGPGSDRLSADRAAPLQTSSTLPYALDEEHVRAIHRPMQPSAQVRLDPQALRYTDPAAGSPLQPCNRWARQFDTLSGRSRSYVETHRDDGRERGRGGVGTGRALPYVDPCTGMSGSCGRGSRSSADGYFLHSYVLYILVGSFAPLFVVDFKSYLCLWLLCARFRAIG
ncbi:hypothetical protein DENSPDRAFT_191270 [Dentipellis sp. KUC8613]|nr:hypothetical protein DENSPDRAFT_191270 [Dentipellis sp. KUC8613]